MEPGYLPPPGHGTWVPPDMGSKYLPLLLTSGGHCQGITFDMLSLAKATKAVSNVKAVWPTH